VGVHPKAAISRWIFFHIISFYSVNPKSDQNFKSQRTQKRPQQVACKARFLQFNVYGLRLDPDTPTLIFHLYATLMWI